MIWFIFLKSAMAFGRNGVFAGDLPHGKQLVFVVVDIVNQIEGVDPFERKFDIFSVVIFTIDLDTGKKRQVFKRILGYKKLNSDPQAIITAARLQSHFIEVKTAF